MEEKNKIEKKMKKGTLIIPIVMVIACFSYVLINDRMNNNYVQQLHLDSLKGNIIISDNVYQSMKDYLVSFYPKENAVMIFGSYNNLTDTIIISDWRPVESSKSTWRNVRISYAYTSKDNFLGTVHSHPSSNITEKICKLSNLDKRTFRGFNNSESQVIGLVCGNYPYLILFKPVNNLEFQRYVYYGGGITQ